MQFKFQISPQRFEISYETFSYRRCQRARDSVGQPLDALLLIVKDKNVLVHDELVKAARKKSYYLMWCEPQKCSFVLDHAFLIPVDGLDLLHKLFQLSPPVLGRTRKVLFDNNAGIPENLRVIRIQFRLGLNEFSLLYTSDFICKGLVR